MQEIDKLLDEYTREKQYVEEEKPYWMSLTSGTSFSGPLRYELESYFSEAHYENAIDQTFGEETEEELKSDGGSRTLFYWSDLLGFPVDH